MPREEVRSVVVGALFLFAFLGFLGVSADNTQYLLGAFERNDPNFLANDWFVNATESFHPLFETFMAWWLKLDQLVAGLFLWYAINLLALSIALLALIKYLGVASRLDLAMVLAVGMLLAGVRYGWGMYEVLTGQALPAYLAYPPAILSFVLLCQRRFLAAAVAVVVTFLIHYGLGALLILCMLGPIALTLPRTRNEFVQAALGAALILIVFLPIVLGTVDKDSGQASDLAILFYGRSPQHFAVQFSDLQVQLRGMHIFVASILLAFTIRSREVRLRVLSFIASVAALCALGYVFLEVIYIPTFVRLFPYRAIPILVVLNSCMIASLFLVKDSTRRGLGIATLVALSSVSFQYSVPLSTAILVSAIGLRWVSTMNRPAASRDFQLALSVVCSAVVASLLFATYSSRPAFFPEWPPPSHQLLSNAIVEQTPPDSIIVVPPWLSGIRTSAERAIVVNTKSFPVYGPEMVQWSERIRDISGIDPRDAKQYLQQGANIWQLYSYGYASRSMQDLVTAAHKYKATYILVTTDSRFHWEAGQKGLRPLWSGIGYALYKSPDHAT